MSIFSRDECKPIIKVSGTSIEVGTIKGPVQLPIDIQGVKVDQKVLQQVSAIAQVLDIRQVENCRFARQIIKQLPNVDDNKKLEVLVNLHKDTDKLFELAMIALADFKDSGSYEKALAGWVGDNGPTAFQAAPKVAKSALTPSLTKSLMAFSGKRSESFDVRKALGLAKVS